MNYALEEIKSILRVNEFTFDQDVILEFTRFVSLNEKMGHRSPVLINGVLFEVTMDEVLVILGIMRDSKISIYKNLHTELFPAPYILISWTDLTDTWSGYFIESLTRVRFQEKFFD